MNSKGLCEIATVVRPLSSADLHESNYPLDDGEYEVPVRGRTGEKRSRASAHLTNEGTVRIDCAENLDFWAELDLPKDYIKRLAKRFDEEEERQAEERRREREFMFPQILK